MPLSSLILEYVDNITVGFKNTSVSQKKDGNRLENNSDWLCTEGTYEN
jgi:hypothetical protein